MATLTFPYFHTRRRVTGGLLAFAVIALVCAIIFLPVKEILLDILAWIESLGYWGCFVMILAYIAANILFIPTGLLTLTAGIVYGVALGSITVITGGMLGASTTFLIGRHLARRHLERRIAGSRRFHALDQAVAREGFKIVLLTRLSPIFPYKVLNYTFGLTGVRFRSFFLATLVGIIPATLFYVYLGAAGKTMAMFLSEGQGSPTALVVQGLGISMALIATIVITRIARRALRESVPQIVEDQDTTED